MHVTASTKAVMQLVGGSKRKYVRGRKCLKLYADHLKYAVNHSPLQRT